MKKAAFLLAAGILLQGLSMLPVQAAEVPLYEETAGYMKRANDYWIANNPEPDHNRWEMSAYFTGDMAAYETLKDKWYYEYAMEWGERHNWEIHNYYDFEAKAKADNQCCGQTYLDLAAITPDSEYMVEGMKGIKPDIDKMLASEKEDDWWWVDAMYMAAPIFTKLYQRYGDQRYLDKMYALYSSMKNDRTLYDTSEHLWYRDERYLYPEYKTTNGKKCFWSRGNGWAFAAHARVLQGMPADYPHRAEFVETFCDMAAALKEIQGEDGFWRMSLYDTQESPAPETSGTAFFTYGMAWGINAGILDRETYLPIVLRAWEGLTQIALQPDGKVGWVQIISDRPAADQAGKDITAPYGVGGFLLAGSEIAKFDATYEDYRVLRECIRDSVAMCVDSPVAVVHENKGYVDENREITPYLKEDSTMLPLRFIAESLDLRVDWNSAENCAQVTGNGHVLTVTPGSAEYIVDGEARVLPVAAELTHDRTMVPVRAVAEGLGLQVYWEERGLVIVSGREIAFPDDRLQTMLIEDMKNDTLRLTAFTTEKQLRDLGFKPKGGRFNLAGATASATPQNLHPAAHAVDGKTDTYWFSEGDQSLTLNLGRVRQVGCVGLVFSSGASKGYYFDIALSQDGETYASATDWVVSKRTDDMQYYYITPQQAQYVRINCHGNEWHQWNMIADAAVFE